MALLRNVIEEIQIITMKLQIGLLMLLKYLELVTQK